MQIELGVGGLEIFKQKLYHFTVKIIFNFMP